MNLFHRRERRAAKLRQALRGKLIVLTGASSGLGRALAVQLASYGPHLVLVSRNAEALIGLRDEIVGLGGSAEEIPCDLSLDDEVRRLAAELSMKFDGVDILINNAAISLRRELVVSLDRFSDIERTMALNYYGPVRMTYALLPAMLKRGSGHIVNSITATVLFPCPRFAAYIASKSALASFMDVLGMELMGNGIRATNLYLPLVNTPMINGVEAYHQDTMKRRGILVPVERAIEPILTALVSRPPRITYGYWIGEVIRFVFPRRARLYMNRLFRSFPTQTCPVPDETRFARRMRATWKKAPL